MLSAAQEAVQKDMSVREVETMVKKLNRELLNAEDLPAETLSKVEVDYLNEAQILLTQALGRRVIIRQANGKGKIELEYYDQEDFNSLFEALCGGGDSPLLQPGKDIV